MSTFIDSLPQSKTILLTTFRRDGTPVDTPVSLAFADGRAFFRTWNKAHKVARLRRDPHVRVAPSTVGGKVTGPAVDARAELLDGGDERLAARALAGRHRLLQRYLVPMSHRLMRWRTMHYELRPHGSGH